MLAVIGRRLIATIPVMVMVAIVVFMMLRLTPGDPAAIIAGDNANAAQIDAIRDQLGLNRPLWEQFAIWVVNLFQGDLGQSYFFKAEVADLIGQRVGPTLALATTTIIITVSVSGETSRRAFMSSRPLTPGIIRSVRTTATRCVRASSSAVFAPSAVSTRKPSRRKIFSSDVTLAGSSSTTRMVAGLVPAAAVDAGAVAVGAGPSGLRGVLRVA